ncbi:hypothetical protein [Methylibium sp.]|uniref:hypothetical protein n=1 Tax=Methylibium sp. TaxID=2067992 RepID=UPI003D1262C4
MRIVRLSSELSTGRAITSHCLGSDLRWLCEWEYRPAANAPIKAAPASSKYSQWGIVMKGKVA